MDGRVDSLSYQVNNELIELKRSDIQGGVVVMWSFDIFDYVNVIVLDV